VGQVEFASFREQIEHGGPLGRDAILTDRRHGQSLRQIAMAHSISRATVHRVLNVQNPVDSTVPKGV